MFYLCNFEYFICVRVNGAVYEYNVCQYLIFYIDGMFYIYTEKTDPRIRRSAGIKKILDDVVQDTFLKYHCSKKEFSSHEHIKAWLLRVAINKAKDHARNQMS